MKYFYLVVLAVLILCVSPVSASGIVVTGGNINIVSVEHSGWTQDYTYTSADTERISIMEFDVPLNSHTNFTLTYGNGKTVDGWIVYKAAGFLQSYSEVHLGDSTYSETFTDSAVAVGCSASGICLDKQVKFSSYAKNTSTDPAQTGLALYAQGYGIYSSQLAFYPVDDLASNMIESVSFTSDDNVYLTIQNDDAEKLASYISRTTSDAVTQKSNDILATLMENLGLILSAIGAILYWLKFFFVDNLITVVVLEIMGTLAAAVATEGLKSRPNPLNIPVVFFTYQAAMIKGFIWIWSQLIDMLTKLVQALLKWL